MNCAELKIKSCIVKSGQKIIESTPKIKEIPNLITSSNNEKKEELQIKLGEKIQGSMYC